MKRVFYVHIINLNVCKRSLLLSWNVVGRILNLLHNTSNTEKLGISSSFTLTNNIVVLIDGYETTIVSQNSEFSILEIKQVQRNN